MTVKDLINELSKFPQDCVVYIDGESDHIKPHLTKYWFEEMGENITEKQIPNGLELC